MTHLTSHELAAWRDSPSAADRPRIVGHLAACAECASRYAEMIRARGPEGAASQFDPQPFATRGYAALAKRRGRVLVFRPLVLVPLATAAALVLAVWLPSTRRAEAPAATAPVVRGARPEALAPAGDVRGPIEFRWASPVSPDRYAVEVRDGHGQRIFYRETPDERLPADAALEAALRTGVHFTWTVAALDGSGEVIAQSTPRAFTRTAPAGR